MHRLLNKENPWLSRDIKMKMNTRDYYLRRAKRTNAEIDWSTYKRYRNIVTNAIRHAKANNIRKTFRENISSPKEFWKQMKKCYPAKEKVKPCKSFIVNGSASEDKTKIADAFCSYFVNVGTKLSSTITSLSNLTWKIPDTLVRLLSINKNHVTFKFSPVNVRDVAKILKSLKSSKASGIDNIPGRMIKDAADELAAPMSLLVNMSLREGVFPTVEKIAKVSPVYKSGERNCIGNYRPISVLNVTSKVIEKVFCNQLTDFLETNNLLSPRQFGFRKNRSTQHAVTQLVDHIRENIDKGKLTGALYMDFRKAFDTVNHACLISKLPYYGIHDNELKWLSDYLFNRRQTVYVDGTYSEFKHITHGVPQGSIIGPLLFVILVNDLHLKLHKCDLLMYADDTVLYYSDKNMSNIENILNHEANIIHQWITENCLILNLKKGKTEFIVYGSRLSNQPKCTININLTEINNPDNYEYLGVTLDKHVNLQAHYRKVQKKISARINLLARIRYSISPRVAESIFTSMINPLFFYCYHVFSGMNMTTSIKFQSLQNRAKSIVNTTIARNWPSIETQRNRKIALDVFKTIRKIDNGINHQKYELLNHRYATRGNLSLLKLPKVRTETGRKSSSYQGALTFNRLAEDLRREQSFTNFKSKLNTITF